jgi:hypothetical protein
VASKVGWRAASDGRNVQWSMNIFMANSTALPTMTRTSLRFRMCDAGNQAGGTYESGRSKKSLILFNG